MTDTADNELFSRTAMLLGRGALEKLGAARVAVFGVGGVGGSCAEALARSGIGGIDLYDGDRVSMSNINRQAVALHSTLGRYKADVMAERIMDINPACEVGVFKIFYMPDTADETDLSAYDYIVDAIDAVAGKAELVVRAKAAGVKIICAMGAGDRLDPAKFAVTDIYKTEGDPLARAVRKELRTRGVTDLKVVWSKEAPKCRGSREHSGDGSFCVPASSAFVPPACGLVLASEVVKDLIAEFL